MSACLQLITAANSLIAQIHLVALIAVVKMVIQEVAITVKVLSLCVCTCTRQGPLADIFSTFSNKRDLSVNLGP